jgi:photosystem II stability/assembly factor-like uncharacterized protein
MKKAILFFVIIISIFNCRKNGELFPYLQDTVCQANDTVKSPKGYSLTQLAQIEYKGSFNNLTFFDENTGFLYGNNIFGSYPDVFKTEDGGKTWKNLNINISEIPISIAFKNKDLGFISIHDSKGCPSNCQNRCLLMITEDGGKTWKKNEYPDYKGQLHHIQFDEKGNLYAALSSYENSIQTLKMLKSINDGKSWNVLYESPIINFTSIYFSFLLRKEVLYIAGKLGKIIKIDTKGNFLETIETGQKYIQPLTVIDENTYVMDGFDGLIKSIDGGKTWKQITTKNTKILNFKSSDNGLVVMNEGYCGQYDAPNSIDVIAYTKDGGLTWIKSEEIRDVIYNYADSYKMVDGRLIVVIGLKVFEIKEQ